MTTKLNAAIRLQATQVTAAKPPIDLVLTKATHLTKAKETPESIFDQDNYKGLVVYVLDIDGKKIFAMSAGSGSDKVGDRVTWKDASGVIENLIVSGPKGKNKVGMNEARPVYSFK